MKVYIVTSSFGGSENYFEHIDGVWDNLDGAIRHKAEVDARYEAEVLVVDGETFSNYNGCLITAFTLNDPRGEIKYGESEHIKSII